MKMIKKEDLRDSYYYLGSSPKVHIGRWDKATGKFVSLVDKEVHHLPHFDDDNNGGFEPRGEVVSMYIMLRNLLTLLVKCSSPGWDGKDAVPIGLDIYEKASVFLESLAVTSSLPMLGAEIDGSITLEWLKNTQNKLFINIGKESQGTYYATLESKVMEGALPISQEVPDFILEIIRNLE